VNRKFKRTTFNYLMYHRKCLYCNFWSI